jgi:hypothetical protein
MWPHDLEIEGFLSSAFPSHSYPRTSASGSGSRVHCLHPPNDCPDCHAYEVHVIYASLQYDAAHSRDLMGTSPGYPESNTGFSPDDILRELYQVRTHLRRVRRERDDAIALNACFQNEAALLESELRETKDRLLAMEMTYGDQNQHWNADFLGEGREDDGLLREEAEQDGFQALSPRNDTMDADLGTEDWVVEHAFTRTDTFSNASRNDSSDSDDFDLFQQVHLMTQENDNPWEDDSSSDAVEKYPQANYTLPVYRVDSSSGSLSPYSSSVSVSSVSESEWAGSQSDDSSSTPEMPISSNEELYNTLTLMASAHEEGNTTALIQIKQLILQSERTPRHERTEAQKYLLLNWRSPSSSRRNSHYSLTATHVQPALVYPISSQGREIFVDASGSGIGFVFGTQWLAWSFKKNGNFPLGGDGKIVMSWAELLAVELGLRALITAGYQFTDITVRSDNTGVIDALKKKTWCPRHGLEDILRNILNLSEKYKIGLKPRWVSTKDNLADMPSRGVFPPRSLCFQFPPKLPGRLLDLLELAVPVTA